MTSVNACLIRRRRPRLPHSPCWNWPRRRLRSRRRGSGVPVGALRPPSYGQLEAHDADADFVKARLSWCVQRSDCCARKRADVAEHLVGGPLGRQEIGPSRQGRCSGACRNARAFVASASSGISPMEQRDKTGVVGSLRQLSASGPISTASYPIVSRNDATAAFAAASSPAIGTALRSAAPADAPCCGGGPSPCC